MKSGNYEIQYYANNKIVRGEDGIYNTQTKIAKKDCNLWFKVIREI